MVSTTLVIITRSGLAFLFLFVLARLKGKTQLSQLNYFDYITGITIGAIAAAMSISTSLPPLGVAAGLLVWIGLDYILDIWVMKSVPARKVLQGEPTIVVQNGKVLEEAMLTAKYNLDELMMQLREKKVFDLSQVQEAVLETNGKLSILLKPEFHSATRKDLNVDTAHTGAEPVVLVVDGNIAHHRLHELGFSEDWLKEQLHKKGINDIQNVMVALLETSGKMYVDIRQDWETRTNITN